jgi:NADPH-dependent 2,4-dienoyl-CoA reductase/sulfur reductase-like enzyme
MTFDRREFLKISAGAGAVAVTGLSGCATSVASARPKVVVVGAGFGGSTFARYLKMWEPKAEITMIEPNDKFVSCPFSNTVLAGINKMEDISFGYDNIKKVVDAWVQDTVTAIDTTKRTVTTSGGKTFAYDRLVLAGGIELLFDKVQGYDAEGPRRPSSTPGRPAPTRPACCASSSKPCPTAAPSSCLCPWPRTVAPPAPTSAPAWSPPTSRRPSRSRRSSSSTAIRTSPPRRDCS